MFKAIEISFDHFEAGGWYRELAVPGIFKMACQPEKVFIIAGVKELHHVVAIGTFLLIIDDILYTTDSTDRVLK